jgi:hypothetical protein
MMMMMMMMLLLVREEGLSEITLVFGGLKTVDR